MISWERDSDLVVADLMTLEPVVVQVTPASRRQRR